MLHGEVLACRHGDLELLHDPTAVIRVDVGEKRLEGAFERARVEAVRGLHLRRPAHLTARGVPAPRAHPSRRERQPRLELPAAELLLGLAASECRAEQVGNAAREDDVVLAERTGRSRVRSQDPVRAAGEPDDRAHRAHDAVGVQARPALESTLEPHVVTHDRRIGLERVARERRSSGADAVGPEQHRIPSRAGSDLEPLRIVGELHRRRELDAETVGQELDGDVEQLLHVVHLEGEAPEIGDARVLTLAQPEPLERSQQLRDVVRRRFLVRVRELRTFRASSPFALPVRFPAHDRPGIPRRTELEPVRPNISRSICLQLPRLAHRIGGRQSLRLTTVPAIALIGAPVTREHVGPTRARPSPRLQGPDRRRGPR